MCLQRCTSLIANTMFSETIPDFSANQNATGMYRCVRCNAILFEANKEFAAGCGFPSFWAHFGDGVQLNPLNTYGRSRIQLLCSNCGLHLGHLFTHKHTPTKLRYCINADNIKLTSA